MNEGRPNLRHGRWVGQSLPTASTSTSDAVVFAFSTLDGRSRFQGQSTSTRAAELRRIHSAALTQHTREIIRRRACAIFLSYNSRSVTMEAVRQETNGQKVARRQGCIGSMNDSSSTETTLERPGKSHPRYGENVSSISLLCDVGTAQRVVFDFVAEVGEDDMTSLKASLENYSLSSYAHSVVFQKEIVNHMIEWELQYSSKSKGFAARAQLAETRRKSKSRPVIPWALLRHYRP